MAVRVKVVFSRMTWRWCLELGAGRLEQMEVIINFSPESFPELARPRGGGLGGLHVTPKPLRRAWRTMF